MLNILTEAPGNNETATEGIDHEAANDDDPNTNPIPVPEMNNQDNESSSVETANSENAPGNDKINIMELCNINY